MSETRFENLRYEVEDGAAWITIDRPTKLNALNRATVQEISRAARMAVDAPEVVALVVTGGGDKAFAAGADIAELATLDAVGAQQLARFLQTSLDQLERCRKPVIAAVNGFALGGGCELAMACHVRIAADTARLGQPEVNLGLVPGAGGTQRLPRLVGRGRALELILGGAMIDAAEALRIGLVNRVVPAAELRQTVSAFVTTLRGKSPVALARAIESVVAGSECSQEEAMRFEAATFGLCFATEDMHEGTQAFLAKRPPKFRGA